MRKLSSAKQPRIKPDLRSKGMCVLDKCSFSYCVDDTDTDLFGFIKISRIFALLQKAATAHVAQIGAGRDFLMKDNVIWILVRQKIELTRSIKAGENIFVETWHAGVKGPYSIRAFEIVSDKGEKLAEAVSQWVLADFTTRRIVRPAQHLPASFVFPFSENGDIVLPEKLGKFADNEDLRKLGERKIAYSDLDVNFHANNARYPDFVCDVTETETRSNEFISGMQINYEHEALCGDVIGFFGISENADGIKIIGRIGTKECLSALVSFRKISENGVENDG